MGRGGMEDGRGSGGAYLDMPYTWKLKFCKCCYKGVVHARGGL